MNISLLVLLCSTVKSMMKSVNTNNKTLANKKELCSQPSLDTHLSYSQATYTDDLSKDAPKKLKTSNKHEDLAKKTLMSITEQEIKKTTNQSVKSTKQVPLQRNNVQNYLSQDDIAYQNDEGKKAQDGIIRTMNSKLYNEQVDGIELNVKDRLIRKACYKSIKSKYLGQHPGETLQKGKGKKIQEDVDKFNGSDYSLPQKTYTAVLPTERKNESQEAMQKYDAFNNKQQQINIPLQVHKTVKEHLLTSSPKTKNLTSDYVQDYNYLSSNNHNVLDKSIFSDNLQDISIQLSEISFKDINTHGLSSNEYIPQNEGAKINYADQQNLSFDLKSKTPNQELTSQDPLNIIKDPTLLDTLNKPEDQHKGLVNKQNDVISSHAVVEKDDPNNASAIPDFPHNILNGLCYDNVITGERPENNNDIDDKICEDFEESTLYTDKEYSTPLIKRCSVNHMSTTPNQISKLFDNNVASNPKSVSLIGYSLEQPNESSDSSGKSTNGFSLTSELESDSQEISTDSIHFTHTRENIRKASSSFKRKYFIIILVVGVILALAIPVIFILRNTT